MRERRKKIAESAKITAGKFAFGETTHARPIASELAWRSLNRGLFISNNFATLSHSSDKGYTSFSIRAPAQNIGFPKHSAMGGCIVFHPPSFNA